MKRILFVDDQPEVLNTHRQSLKKYSGQMEAAFAPGGEAALELMRNTPVDVVVADMHMPGMDGPALLRRTKDEHPEVLRLLLCPQYEVDPAYFSLLTVHQVLAKPLDADTLLNIVERTSRLRELLTDSLKKKIGSLGQLPPTPTVYLELTDAMNRPEVSNRTIARIIEKDPQMAAKTLQLVNSACFGIQRRIGTVEQAVVYLGIDLIRALSLTVQVAASLDRTAVSSGFSFDAEQEHSMLTARVARRIVKAHQAQCAFTAALLHDIGKLLLAVCVPEGFKKVLSACKTTDRPSHEIEAEMLGVTHAEVGAYLLGLWGLPFPVVEAVAYHHNPAAALERNFDVPTAVSIANALVENITKGRPVPIVDHLQSLRSAEALSGWTTIARQEAQMQQSTPERAMIR